MKIPTCTSCRLHLTSKKNCVPGRGKESAKYMVLVDSPKQNTKELREELRERGIRKAYIMHAVSCHSEKAPTDAQLRECQVHLNKTLKAVNPKYILTMGSGAYQAITGKKGLMRSRGVAFDHEGAIVMPTVGLGAMYYDPKNRILFDRDVGNFKAILKNKGMPEEKRLNYKFLGPDDMQELLDKVEGEMSFDIETNGLYPWAKDAKITRLGFGTDKWQYSFDPLVKGMKRWLKKINKKLRKCRLIMHNGKFDSLWVLVHLMFDWMPDDDTMIMHYLMDENSRHGLKYLAQVYEDAPNWDVDLDTKQGTEDPLQLTKYHAHDLFYTFKLKKRFQKSMEKKIKSVYSKIMMPMLRVYRDAEYYGCYVNHDRFEEVEIILRKELRKAERMLSTFGDINWGSGQQLADLLYRKMGIEVPEYTKTGMPSTSESALNQIDHPIRGYIMDYRRASKQLSAFIEGWKPYLHNSRLHPSFKITGTVTGRISCQNPNLQQIPRDPRIRSLITAPPGYTFMEFDLSQIELRIAAELSRSTTMIQAFKRKIDLHWLTAIKEIGNSGAMVKEVTSTAKAIKGKKVSYSEAIDIVLLAGPAECAKIDPVWKELRKKAKAINFGYLFGMWWKKFKIYARDNYGVTITDAQAKESRENFFITYPELGPWHERQKSFVRRHGFVRSLSGRKRRLPDALIKTARGEYNGRKSQAERQSINSPVQSFANELNFMVAIEMHKRYKPEEVMIVGTVHDAIHVHVRNDLVRKVAKEGLKMMTKPKLLKELKIKLDVPIEGDCTIGPWGTGVELHDYKEAA